MTDNMDFAKARDEQQAFKGQCIHRCGVALVTRALELCDAGVDYFGPDDLPDGLDWGGVGIVGSTVKMLHNANVIEPYPYVRERTSRHKSRHGSPAKLWRLTSRARAETYLARNGAEVKARYMHDVYAEPTQGVLAI